MCTSRPKIPDNKTPPAPNAPEAAPDSFALGDRARYQQLRRQGLLIPTAPDLSMLGNTPLGKPTSTLLIRPEAHTPINAEDAVAAADARAAAAVANANAAAQRPSNGLNRTPGGARR